MSSYGPGYINNYWMGFLWYAEVSLSRKTLSAEGEADNSYRDIDNLAYQKNRI